MQMFMDLLWENWEDLMEKYLENSCGKNSAFAAQNRGRYSNLDFHFFLMILGKFLFKKLVNTSLFTCMLNLNQNYEFLPRFLVGKFVKWIETQRAFSVNLSNFLVLIKNELEPQFHTVGKPFESSFKRNQRHSISIFLH